MAIYQRQCYLFMTLDPVHIGTGGYRLGRVDNSIVREPGTKIPKIPGTSLHGAARAYAAQLYGTPEAAGQSHDAIEKLDENPVCYTFGYLEKSKDGDKNNQGKAYSGVVNIFDAHILLFPVHSMAGPVWVTTVERLEDAGFTISGDFPSDWEMGQVVLDWQRTDPLNLGWLMLGIAGQVSITPPSEWQNEKRYEAICGKIAIAQNSLFSQIVNSNLEVRTSVAIEPETGAASEGALFTYEAIPRATFLTADVVLDDYRKAFPSTTLDTTGDSWNNAFNVVNSGFKLIEWLGVGGMGTRGFGRMAMVGKPLEKVFGKELINE
ncbi:CRISPR-associated RAMP Cmr4 [Geitlerinema sp. FC II]|nr:CRISPR-associated RAMP Cmr4 [Geitlerinema sp. FC II]